MLRKSTGTTHGGEWLHQAADHCTIPMVGLAIMCIRRGPGHRDVAGESLMPRSGFGGPKVPRPVGGAQRPRIVLLTRLRCARRLTSRWWVSCTTSALLCSRTRKTRPTAAKQTLLNAVVLRSCPGWVSFAWLVLGRRVWFRGVAVSSLWCFAGLRPHGT